jgi:hypothetical protein
VIYYLTPYAPVFYKERGFDTLYPCFKYWTGKFLENHWREYNPIVVNRVGMTIGLILLNPSKPKEGFREELEISKGWHGNSEGGLSHSWKTSTIRETPGFSEKIVRNAMKQIDQIRKILEARNIQFFVYLSPVPEGDESFSELKRIYSPLIDNAFKQLANGYFQDRVHVNVSGALQESISVANFLKSKGF